MLGGRKLGMCVGAQVTELLSGLAWLEGWQRWSAVKGADVDVGVRRICRKAFQADRATAWTSTPSGAWQRTRAGRRRQSSCESARVKRKGRTKATAKDKLVKLIEEH